MLSYSSSLRTRRANAAAAETQADGLDIDADGNAAESGTGGKNDDSGTDGDAIGAAIDAVWDDGSQHQAGSRVTPSPPAGAKTVLSPNSGGPGKDIVHSEAPGEGSLTTADAPEAGGITNISDLSPDRSTLVKV